MAGHESYIKQKRYIFPQKKQKRYRLFRNVFNEYLNERNSQFPFDVVVESLNFNHKP